MKKNGVHAGLKPLMDKASRKVFVLALLSVFLMASCAIHKGTLQNSASLSTNNFSYVKRNATGSARSMLVFGIGGFLKKSLIDEAKRELLRDNPLQDNQVLANITVNEKQAVYVFVIVQEVTITADIVQFK